MGLFSSKPIQHDRTLQGGGGEGNNFEEAVDILHRAPPESELGLETTRTTLRYDDYTIGWICALWFEELAALAVLDELHGRLPRKPGDMNTYAYGSIDAHNVIIACLPSLGNNNAATAAAHMSRTFPNIDKWLVVGVGGGVPVSSSGVAEWPDIRLGDVVIGTGVIQHDLGKSMPGRQFERTGPTLAPDPYLMGALRNFQASCALHGSHMPSRLRQMAERYPHVPELRRPEAQDVLFKHTYNHALPGTTNCDGCDPGQRVPRIQRQKNCPAAHYGLIASGNTVMRDGAQRQELVNELGVLCFEMEAAGLMHQTGCLVIRGICDYSDSHKNKQWQPYAATTAAAFARGFIQSLATAEPHTQPLDGRSMFASRQPPELDGGAALKVRERLMKSLEFVEMGSRRRNIRPAQHKTCEWFLQHPTYLQWLDPEAFPRHHGFLWIKGKPGAGKSTLIKFIHDRTKERPPLAGSIHCLSFFFHARGAGLEKSIEGMYRSLLHQIFHLLPDIVASLPDAEHITREEDTTCWSLNELQDLLWESVKCLGHRQLICFIDALDECDRNEVRDMVGGIEDICAQAYGRGIHVYVCFSSRHFPNVNPKPGSLSLVLEAQNGHSEDIVEYVKNKLRAPTGEALHKLSQSIISKAAGVFMWVVLVVDILNEELESGETLSAATQRLHDLPAGLTDLFNDILSRGNTAKDSFFLCISWILYAIRPIDATELYFALRFTTSLARRGSLARWNQEALPPHTIRLWILHQSKGLAQVTKYGTVELIHESVRDFLVIHNGIKNIWPDGPNDFKAWSHDRMADCCASYMLSLNSRHIPCLDNKEEVEDEEEQRHEPQRHPGTHAPLEKREARLSRRSGHERVKTGPEFPLLGYAVNHFPYHANCVAEAEVHSRSCSSYSACPPRKRSVEDSAFARWRTLASYFYGESRRPHSERNQQRYLGRRNTMISYRLSSKLYQRRTLLEILIELDHGALVENHLSVDSEMTLAKQEQLQHAIIFAAEAKRLGIAKRLLQVAHFDINLEAADGRTLLSSASERGLGDLCEYMVAHLHAKVNTKDKLGCSPLFYACKHGHYDTVRCILETQGVDPQVITVPVQRPTFDKTGEIHWADELLATAPLCSALLSGDETTLGLLLSSQVKAEGRLRPDLSDTLLLIAAFKGYESSFRLLWNIIGANARELLSRSDHLLPFALSLGPSPPQASLAQRLKVDRANINGITFKTPPPLVLALFKNHLLTIEQLLNVPGINVNLLGSDGNSALIIAATIGNVGLVHKLLTTPGINVNIRNNQAQTALIMALRNGHHSIASMLRRVSGIDLDGQTGKTVLVEAVYRDRPVVMELPHEVSIITSYGPRHPRTTTVRTAASLWLPSESAGVDSQHDWLHTTVQINEHLSVKVAIEPKQQEHESKMHWTTRKYLTVALFHDIMKRYIPRYPDKLQSVPSRLKPDPAKSGWPVAGALGFCDQNFSYDYLLAPNSSLLRY